MDHQNVYSPFNNNLNPISGSQVHQQIFTGVGQNGQLLSNADSPISHFASTFDHDAQDGADDNDAKRRRIARACDMCRKKKIKCDGRLPKCGHCTNYKTECIFTYVEKKRNPPKGAKYIEGLENRLGRMEQLLRTAGLITDDNVDRSDLAAIEKLLIEQNRSTSNAVDITTSKFNVPGSRTQSTAQRQSCSPGQVQVSPRESVDTPLSTSQTENTEKLSELMCSLVTNGSGETRYIGSSSALSIFSSKGIEWINSKTGDTSFQDTISRAICEEDEEQKGFFWKPEIFGDLFMRRVFRPLPSKQEALSLFKDFFDNFNCMFPLFHEPTFMYLVERQYSDDPYEGTGWWACINVVLAISHRLRVMSNVVPRSEERHAWLYLKNAMSVITEITLQNADLLGVQALVGMAMFLLGSANPTPSFFLIAAAIRLSHSIGLHKKGATFNLNPVEAEQRKRVFWIAYMLDKDMCIRSGRPPAQDDDDVNVELPAEDPPDGVGNVPLGEGEAKINLFRLMCEFSLISSKIYKRLYSVAASKQTDGELLNTIGDLDRELEIWKDTIPIDFRPEHEIKVEHPALLIHIVILHFQYYNAVTTIHRMSVHHGYWTSRLSDFAVSGLNTRMLNPRVFASASLCVSAARASVHLIKYIPQGDYACVLMIMYFPVSALVTIFANILQNPQDIKARADIKLMDLVVGFLTKVVAEEGATSSFKRMLTICSEFTRIARLVLDKAESEGGGRKRKMNPEQQQQQQQKQQQQQQKQQTSQRAMAQAQAIARNAGAVSSSPPGARRSLSVSNSPKRTTSSTKHAPQLIAPAPTPALAPAPPSPSYLVQQSTQTSAPIIQTFPQSFSHLTNYSEDYVITSPLMVSNESPSNIDFPSPDPIYGNSSGSGLTDPNAFQNPFVPQDMWQLPMTFEWDLWQDFSGQTQTQTQVQGPDQG